ncbi:hypothetical protein F4782DRAFT_532973 [Xylaria castorea]|nr:hypothetical protein F4782DRAFT_532973 [Xylaria castorea]
MNQQRDDHAQSMRTSSQTGGEDDEICSNKATGGSSDPGSDDLYVGLVLTRSRSSERGLQRLTTMRHPRDQQASQTSGPDTARAIPGTSSSHGSSSFMGLTLAPLPSAMLPTKKRPLDEVLNDQTLPDQDKMAAEIDQLASEAPVRPHALSVGSSETQDVAPSEPPRRKKSKTNEESTPQALPIIVRHAATTSDRRGRTPPERRSEHLTNASHRGSRATSD